MTDNEFELLDALYFTLPFSRLKEELGWEESVLKGELYQLIVKGWVKCLEQVTDHEIEGLESFELSYNRYSYLATKEGLIEHNSR